jgi:prolyl 4-hydroxylase
LSNIISEKSYFVLDEYRFDGTYDSYQNNGRTSTNAWCLEECYDDALTKNVLTKIENLTGIPDANSEYLQLLKYEVGQFYNTHHDYINFHLERAQGVRILTVFLYLNDVEEGGGTNFPKLNVTVEPKRGRVLVWPSVKNESPDIKDFRTDHQALPVIQGVKYGANAWLHQRDFKTPFQVNCI